MALPELAVRPGIFSNDTDRGAKSRWKEGDHVRFRNGLPETIGGSTRVTLSGAQVVGYSAGIIWGKARAVHDWTSLDGTKFSAIGTNNKLYLVTGAVLYDITPLRATGVIDNNPISTTSGLTAVTIHDTGHGAVAGDFVTFSGATAVGGITIVGNYPIISITDADHYVITHSSAATSTASGGGAAVNADYEIAAGLSGDASTDGWGNGVWGQGGWGNPLTVSDDAASSATEIRIWSLDNWGEDLIASPRSGRIYLWDKTGGTGARATLITQSPTNSNRVFVAQEERILVSAGSHDGSLRDQVLIRWTDKEDYTVWTPVYTNSAGDVRASAGSRVIAVVKTKLEHIIFTDIAIYSFRFIGGNDVFELRKLAENVSIAGPNAACEINGVVYFMGKNNFYKYDGVVKELQCDIWTTVFGSFNASKIERVFCGTNQLFSEIRWFYPSAAATDNDRAAIYNYRESVWSPQTIARTAWHDHSIFFRKPYAINTGSFMAKHEDGYNDVSSTGGAVAVNSYIESWDTDIADGDRFLHIDRLIPDFDALVGTGSVTLKSRDYPSDAQDSDGPYTVTSATDKVDARARNRQIALRWSMSELSGFWRMGRWRYGGRPHGRR